MENIDEVNNDKEFLNWIYERMICVHGEKDLHDYMINFKAIIDRIGSVAAPKEAENAEPYFHLSKNEYGKMWLMYKPEGEGRYKCWEPITEEFWNEFEKLLRRQSELTSLRQQLKEREEALKELLPIAENAAYFAGFLPQFTESELEQYENESKPIIEKARKLILK